MTLEGELRATQLFGEQEIFLGSGAPGGFFGEIPILLDVAILCSFEWSPTAGFSVCREPDSGTCYVLAFGGKGNHADACDAIAQYGGL